MVYTDTDYFDIPQGKFTGVVHVDVLLVNNSEGVLTINKPTVEAIVRKYVGIVD